MTLPAQPGLVQLDDPATCERRARPWNVVVHDDPVNLMSYVTLAFRRVFGYPRAKAEQLMLTVHHHGRAVVWSGDREQAELYVQQLHGHQLRASLELPPG